MVTGSNESLEARLYEHLQNERLTADEGTAENYAISYRNLRQKGEPIPTNDMWIAATALQHGFAVFTYDGYFKYVDGLKLGNRLSDFVR